MEQEEEISKNENIVEWMDYEKLLGTIYLRKEKYNLSKEHYHNNVELEIIKSKKEGKTENKTLILYKNN